jgi:hypothetical protein
MIQVEAYVPYKVSFWAKTDKEVPKDRFWLSVKGTDLQYYFGDTGSDWTYHEFFFVPKFSAKYTLLLQIVWNENVTYVDDIRVEVTQDYVPPVE